MSFNTDIDYAMKDYVVDEEMRKKILNSTVKSNGEKGKRVMKKKVLVLAVAAIMSVGTIAVGAESISTLWNSTVANWFGIDEEVQKQSIEKGFVEVLDGSEKVSATDGDIKVSIEQISVNNSSASMYVSVEALDGRAIKDNMFMCYENEILVDGKAPDAKYKISTYSGDTSQFGENQNGFWLLCRSESEIFEAGKEITIVFKNLWAEDRYVDISKAPEFPIIEGEWKLSFVPKNCKGSKSAKINKVWERKVNWRDFNETITQTLTDVEIYPNLLCVKFTGDTVVETPELPAVVVMEDGTKRDLSCGIYERDTGTEYRIDYRIGPEVTGYQGLLEKGNFGMYTDECYSIYFVEPIDVDEVAYVEIVGEKIEVK